MTEQEAFGGHRTFRLGGRDVQVAPLMIGQILELMAGWPAAVVTFGDATMHGLGRGAADVLRAATTVAGSAMTQEQIGRLAPDRAFFAALQFALGVEPNPTEPVQESPTGPG